MKENKIPENYTSSQTIDELYSNTIIQLEKDKAWCEEKRDNWAKIKSYDFSEKIVIFNLGILAFVGAISQKLEILFLITSIFSVSSIILSFYIMRRVSNKNTKLLNDKDLIFSKTIIKLYKKEESFESIMSKYNWDIIKKQKELISEDSIIKIRQRISIILFLSSIISVIIGITIELNIIHSVLGIHIWRFN